jgi:hypothetical protein
MKMCGKCIVDLRCTRNGVAVADVDRDGVVRVIRMADEYNCPRCGMKYLNVNDSGYWHDDLTKEIKEFSKDGLLRERMI